MAIYRSGDLGRTWTIVYEDRAGTYANHFFRSPSGAHLCLGVGTGKRPDKPFTPAAGYLLHSTDDGRSWSRAFTYDHACALYDGYVSDDGDYLLAGREHNTLIRGSLTEGKYTEVSFGRPCRNVAYIPDLQKYVITSDSGILVASDSDDWSPIVMPIPFLSLRYPIYRNGLIYFTATGWTSLIVATDLERWYVISDLSSLTSSGFGRMALFRDHLYCGSEFDGQMVRVALTSRPRRLGVIRKAGYLLRRALGARDTFSQLSLRS